MGTLALLTLGSSFSLGLLLSLQFVVEIIRTRRLKELELKPNCLLTRYPIVFLTGRRSIFYFKNYWNQVPNFLAEHGYEVEILELPWKNGTARLAAAEAMLASRSRPCHLIADSSQLKELEALWLLHMPSVMTATVATQPRKTTVVTANDLKPPSSGINTLALPETKQLSVKGLFLGIHNFLSGRTDILPAEVGANSPAETFLIERKYLEHAISLAERDAR